MYYAILAYHVEETIASMTPEEDAALMDDLLELNDRFTAEGRLGPAARLGGTGGGVTLRGPGKGVVLDGPFAETKEQLLGFYVVQTGTLDEAVDMARELRQANPTAVYEIRPILLYRPGAALPGGEGPPPKQALTAARSLSSWATRRRATAAVGAALNGGGKGSNAPRLRARRGPGAPPERNG